MAIRQVERRRLKARSLMHNGSMDSSWATTGDFENFIARDVVSHIGGLDRGYCGLAPLAMAGGMDWTRLSWRLTTVLRGPRRSCPIKEPLESSIASLARDILVLIDARKSLSALTMEIPDETDTC